MCYNNTIETKEIKMKKVLNLMIALCCVLSCAFIFSGCDMFHKEHTASEEWTMNSTHHWHKCTECGKDVDKAEHDWKETVLIEATQTEDGVMHYECNVCGMDRVEKYSITTVTEEAWNNAFDLLACDNFQLTAEFDGENHSFIRNRNIICITSNPKDESDGYYSKEDDKYYHYKQESGVWAKIEISQDDYNRANHSGSEFGEEFAEIGIHYSDFVYNEEIHAYECEVVREWPDGEYSKKFTMHYASGKLVKIIVGNYQSNKPITYTFGYDNIELELHIIG